jgi:predicted NAD/FAD-binding protein
MTGGNEAPPARKSGNRRADRLAAALKQNLKKRKELARARRRPDGSVAVEASGKLRDDDEA